MNDAINYLFLIYTKFIALLFTDLDIGNGVTVGWVILTCIVFSILLKNILAIPSRSGSLYVRRSDNND